MDLLQFGIMVRLVCACGVCALLIIFFRTEMICAVRNCCVYVYVRLLDDECAAEDDGWLVDAVVLVTATTLLAGDFRVECAERESRLA